ncbi:hypothetical protein NBRC10512_000980 [Rhodotorula toruloides]|uniref:RHTO0S17e03334g1_1 n=2 Tax=Rhodotorula toruloides TaxID=5286 RepID=A0A061BMX1_RHOTO|nr:uncharacterized protein RHTO_03447 [Rhodotorula toruloides NP11]EMS20528.1 hypothetical protein RHTO_03447 [Rhodotorula toruloides NP11]CDR48426.1 RHTO0S17e03334g1_1 [Rhodotorula toruloides]
MLPQDMSIACMRTYKLEENEALEGRQVVSVSDEASGRTIWTNTRELVGDVIVSTVFDSLHNPRWSVHRPTRGWYLRLRRVSLPPSSSESDKPPLPHPDDARLIELRAVKRSKRTRPERSGIELDFRTDTLSFPSSASSSSSFDAQQTRDETRLDMSPTVELSFPTARATSATSTSPTRHRKRPSSVSASPVDPHSSMSANPEPEDPVERPVRQRVMSTFRVRPLARPRAGGVSALFRRVKSLVWEDEPRGFECVWWSSVARQDGAEKASEVEEGEGLDEVEEAERVVLRFVEQPTSFLHPRLSGSLSLSPSLIDASTLEPSFWVTLAFAVCECEEEREGWEAAREG